MWPNLRDCAFTLLPSGIRNRRVVGTNVAPNSRADPSDPRGGQVLWTWSSVRAGLSCWISECSASADHIVPRRWGADFNPEQHLQEREGYNWNLNESVAPATDRHYKSPSYDPRDQVTPLLPSTLQCPSCRTGDTLGVFTQEDAYVMTTIYADGRWATTTRSHETGPAGQWLPDMVFESGHLKLGGEDAPLLTRRELRLTCVPAIAEAKLQLYGKRQRARNAHRSASPTRTQGATVGTEPR